MGVCNDDRFLEFFWQFFSEFFFIIIFEYIIAIAVALKWLEIFSLPIQPFIGKKVFIEYLIYCSPLIIYSLLGFAHEFTDRWLLQYFGGSEEQGLYEVSSRFCTVSLLAATSIMNIFWKEFAEAKENEALERMQKIYTKFSRFLFAFGAIISGFLIPWSNEIVSVFLGKPYMNSVPVLVIMLVFSIYAAVGQINNTVMYAANRTKEQLVIGGVVMAAGMVVSYFLQAPQNAMIPGLELGAMGIAIKRVLVTLISVNIITWWISRSYGWKFDWSYQFINLMGVLLLGWASRQIALTILAPLSLSLIFSAVLGFTLYVLMIGIIISYIPWLAGLEKHEVIQYIKNPFKILRN